MKNDHKKFIPTEIRLNDEKLLDEVVGENYFHLEQMTPTCWWIDLGGVKVFLNSNTEITATYDDERSDPIYKKWILNK